MACDAWYAQRLNKDPEDLVINRAEEFRVLLEEKALITKVAAFGSSDLSGLRLVSAECVRICTRAFLECVCVCVATRPESVLTESVLAESVLTESVLTESVLRHQATPIEKRQGGNVWQVRGPCCCAHTCAKCVPCVCQVCAKCVPAGLRGCCTLPS